jgi:hypothetical protein
MQALPKRRINRTSSRRHKIIVLTCKSCGEILAKFDGGPAEDDKSDPLGDLQEMAESMKAEKGVK